MSRKAVHERGGTLYIVEKSVHKERKIRRQGAEKCSWQRENYSHRKRVSSGRQSRSG